MLGSSSSDADAESPVRTAVEALRRGDAVVYPTETFYGLGVDATCPPALERLRQLKLRAAGKPISVLVADRRMLGAVATAVPPEAERLMDRFWPGPLTLVLPARPDLSPLLTAGTGTIGVRCSSHPLAQALVSAFGGPVTTPSANPAAAEPPVTVAEARGYFADDVAVYVDGGELPGGLGSTVLALHPQPRILRAGVLPEADIFRVLEERR